MAIAFALSTQPAERVRADVLAVPMFDGGRPGPGADLLQAALGDGLAAFMAEAGFTGKRDETLVVPAGAGRKAAVLVGLGERGTVSTDQLRRAAAAVARAASRARSVVTTLLAGAPDLDPGAAAQALAEGFALGSYRFLTYKSDGEASKLRRVTVVGDAGAPTRAGLGRGVAVAEAVAWARDMVNEPSGAKKKKAEKS